MDIPSKRGACETAPRFLLTDPAEMFSRLQNSPIGQRMMLALALPIAGFLMLALWGVMDQQRVADDMRHLHAMTHLATRVSGLVHEIQRERGLSAAFLGSKGLDFGAMQAQRHAATDAQAELFSQALAQLPTERFAPRLKKRIAEVRDDLANLSAWRLEATQLQVATEVQSARYSALIDALLGIVREMHLMGNGAELSRAIYAYVNLMQAKEMAGMERALGATYFSAPRGDASARQVFVGLTERQSHFLEQFRFYADREQTEFLEQALSNDNLAEIEQMRAGVFLGTSGKASRSTRIVTRWIDLASWKIDQMKRVEDRVSQDLLDATLSAQRGAEKVVLWSGGAALVAMALTLLIAGALARGIIHPIRRITAAMNRLAAPDARVDAVQVTDQERGDEIGDMARASVVFRDNLIRIAQTEERLKHAVIQRLHHKALGAISQGVLIVDAQDKTTFVNAAMCAITGYLEADVLGRPPGFLWTDPQGRSTLWGSAGAPCTLQGKRRDGQPFLYEATVNPVAGS